MELPHTPHYGGSGSACSLSGKMGFFRFAIFAIVLFSASFGFTLVASTFQ
jgi:hypothetical protein